MSRIHIGPKNGRMGAWISAPGQDASAEGHRMILNSDADFLKIHATVEGRSDGFSVPGTFPTQYDHASITLNFPALSYVPLVYVAARTTYAWWTALFPSVIAEQDYLNDDEPRHIGSFVVYNNRVVVEPQAAGVQTNSSRIDVMAHIFKNRVL